MKQQRNDLPALLARMEDVIDVARDADLAKTAALLRLAKLDLMLRATGEAPCDADVASSLLAETKPRKTAAFPK